MDSDLPHELVAAISELWRKAPSVGEQLSESTSFQQLIGMCVRLYPDVIGEVGRDGARRPDRDGIGAALRHAFIATGAPWLARTRFDKDPLSIPLVAAEIDRAFRAKSTTVVHLCPLDRGANIPSVHFDICKINEFSTDALEDLVHAPRLARRGIAFDSKKFARIKWLVVRETVELPKPVGARAIPILYQIVDWNITVQPHEAKYPIPVERALFTLLLAEWERAVGKNEFDWRPFRVPWVYTFTDDPFAAAPVFPDAESLSWEHRAYTDDATGELVEYEVPYTTNMDDAVVGALMAELPSLAELVNKTCSASCINPLVRHFLIRAFTSDGIDELLFHTLTIEAALGREEERQGILAKLKERIRRLTGRHDAGGEFAIQYDRRSTYIHGRNMQELEREDLIAARKLAREVAFHLVCRAADNPHLGRDEFLNQLEPA